MDFSLRNGIELNSVVLSILVFALYAIYIRKRFDLALSIFVVGYYILQYTEINLYVWRGSLLVPIVALFTIQIFNLKNTRNNNNGGLRLIGLLLVSFYFLLMIGNSFIRMNNFYYFSMSLLVGVGLIYGPFYGVWKIAGNSQLIYNHIKYNAYISAGIGVGYIVVIIQKLATIPQISELRNVKFLGMPIGGFSYLLLWSYFYFISLILSRRSNKYYSYIPVFISIIVILISQTRGLLLSLGFGTIIIIYIAKRKSIVLGFVISTFIAIIALDTLIVVNSESKSQSLVSVYSDRFDGSMTGTGIAYDSRFDIWSEAWGVIMNNPLGGGRISYKVGVHNIYLSIMLQYGVLGGVLIFTYLVLLLFYSKYILNKLKYSENEKLIQIAMVGMAMMVHSLVGGLLGSTLPYLFWSMALILKSSELFLIRDIQD